MSTMTMAKLPRLAKSRGPEARAAQVVAEHALNGRFRYAPGLGWLAWDGMRWASRETSEPRGREAVREFADRAERAFRNEAALHMATMQRLEATVMSRVRGLDEADALAAVAQLKPKDLGGQVQDNGTAAEREQYSAADAAERAAAEQADIWLNLLSAAALRNLLALAGDREGILTETTAFDRHPDLLNCRNGVVDLRTGEIRDHDPALLMTKVAGGEYIPGAEHRAWKSGLAAVADGCAEWFQTRMGQSATGHRPDDDVMFVCWGGGSNGKSTVLSAVQTALGDYAGVIPHKVLLNSDPNAHTTELMNFRGLRLAVMEETPEEGHLNVDRVKKTVGTQKIKARLMRRDDVEFETTHTMWINTNHMPQVATTDHGTWRRLVAVPWPYRFRKPGEPMESENDREGDLTLRPTLIDSPEADVMAAVLAWVVTGAMRWYAAGRISPSAPAAVTAASAAWQEDSNVALQFIRDYLIDDPNGFVPAADLKGAFDTFMDEQGKRPWSAQTINARLADSLTSEGFRLTATPVAKGKVRVADVQSSAPAQFRTAVAYGAGSQLRMWRGLRFRTSADPAGDSRHLRTA